ncbi:MAG: hypothetical protein JWN58_1782 [Gammaproteobacteria bacterium]|nr:hypothetical protein [Gammaproteobacteria bacterium]
MKVLLRYQTLQALLRLTLLVPMAFSFSAMAQESGDPGSRRTEHSPLVDKVQNATKQFKDLNVALRHGWVPATPCVSGPEAGAMGVHFALTPQPGQPDRVHDGAIYAADPEFVFYEPMPNGAMRLVGVEFVVIASEWAARHPEGGTPSLDGNLLNFIDAPNRYGLPAFYELHVWAWEHNPQGTFADWNTRVSCDEQPAP